MISVGNLLSALSLLVALAQFVHSLKVSANEKHPPLIIHLTIAVVIGEEWPVYERLRSFYIYSTVLFRKYQKMQNFFQICFIFLMRPILFAPKLPAFRRGAWFLVASCRQLHRDIARYVVWRRNVVRTHRRSFHIWINHLRCPQSRISRPRTTVPRHRRRSIPILKADDGLSHEKIVVLCRIVCYNLERA